MQRLRIIFAAMCLLQFCAMFQVFSGRMNAITRPHL